MARDVDWPQGAPIGNNGHLMAVESRDSISLKPAELDELGQFVQSVGLPLADSQLDTAVEQFPLVTICTEDDDLHGFLFGSLERVGGTPCILWGLGAVRKSRNARGPPIAETAPMSQMTVAWVSRSVVAM